MSQQVPLETASGSEASFLDRLPSHLQLAADARSVFAAPVQRGDVTVIPVAKSKWGMGGGTRGRVAERGAGPAADRGGGGGATVTPMGFIELAGGVARFRRIPDPTERMRFMVAAGLFGISLMRTIGFLRTAPRGRRFTVRFEPARFQRRLRRRLRRALAR